MLNLTVRMSLAASRMSISPLAAQWPYLPQPMHEELDQAPTCDGSGMAARSGHFSWVPAAADA